MVELLRGLDTGKSNKEARAAVITPGNQRQISGFPIWANIFFAFAVGIVGLKIKGTAAR